MPLVEVKVLENVFTNEQKGELIDRMTEVFVDLEGEHMRPVTTVLVEEVHGGSWGIGGNALSASDVEALKTAAQR
jgi:4-oxalocrotonate tautomerase